MHILVRSALIPLYYFEDDYFYSIFKRKKFEEERASFYKQQLLTPLRNQSLGGRKSKCKALYELWVLIVSPWHSSIFGFVNRLAVHLSSHHSVHLSVCSSVWLCLSDCVCMSVSVCLLVWLGKWPNINSRLCILQLVRRVVDVFQCNLFVKVFPLL